MKSKVIYYVGNTVTLKTRVNSGNLEIRPNSIYVNGDDTFEIKFHNIHGIEPFAMPGLGSMMSISYDNKNIFLSIVRINIGGQFVVVNRAKTIELFKIINSKRKINIMTTCDYCGKELTENILLQIGNNKFCNNLCRHSFEKNSNKPKIGIATEQLAIKLKLKDAKTTNIVGTIVGTIVAVIVAFSISHGTMSIFRPNVTSIKVLNQTASKINESLPMMLDAETELFTTVGLDGKLEYHYRLINYTAEQIDTNSLMPKIRKNIINTSCTIKDTRDLLNKGVVLEYVYYDKNKREISRFSLNKLQCVNSGL